MIEDIVVLGGTGSIGLQTIDVCCYEKRFHIVGISLKSNIDILIDNLSKLPFLKDVSIVDEIKAEQFKKNYPQYRVFTGKNADIELIKNTSAMKVVNSIVGFEGLLPSLECLKLNKTLCLANKESLVIGGELIKRELEKGFGKLYAIDSEHVALAKLLNNVDVSKVKKMIITASGGSLRDVDYEKLKDVSIEQVLNHPTWKMGKRITIDSTTMVNKGFEFIEASYLFSWDINNIDVLINDESIVHSALEFIDNSYLFEVGPSDMKIPISYALNEYQRVEANYKSIDFDRKTSINFRKFDFRRYPLFELVLSTFKLGGTSMTFFNRVDELAISYFLKGKLSFQQMIEFIIDTVKNDMILISNPNIEDIVKVDKLASELVCKKMN